MVESRMSMISRASSRSRKSENCVSCTSAYRHRNLHSTQSGKCELQGMSPFEMEHLPLLWHDLLRKNPCFCQHVCHSWLMRSLQRERRLGMDDSPFISTPSTSYTTPNMDTVSRDGERIHELLNGIVEAVSDHHQVLECRGLLSRFMRDQSWLRKTPLWLPSSIRRFRAVNGRLLLLSEALIEQFISQLNSEDINDREVQLLIWKHFVAAIVQSMREILKEGAQSISSLSLDSAISDVSSSLSE